MSGCQTLAMPPARELDVALVERRLELQQEHAPARCRGPAARPTNGSERLRGRGVAIRRRPRRPRTTRVAAVMPMTPQPGQPRGWLAVLGRRRRRARRSVSSHALGEGRRSTSAWWSIGAEAPVARTPPASPSRQSPSVATLRATAPAHRARPTRAEASSRRRRSSTRRSPRGGERAGRSGRRRRSASSVAAVAARALDRRASSSTSAKRGWASVRTAPPAGDAPRRSGRSRRVREQLASRRQARSSNSIMSTPSSSAPSKDSSVMPRTSALAPSVAHATRRSSPRACMQAHRDPPRGARAAVR